MARFADARTAKEFLVSRIVSEANRIGVSLSDVERGMLYFSETHWTLPNMSEIAVKFDSEYNPEEYEKKIVHLIRGARHRAPDENPHELGAWADALKTLSYEDHYLLVMFSEAGVSFRPCGDVPKLIGAALAVIATGILFFFVTERFDINRDFLAWVIALSLAISYSIARAVLGPERADTLLAKILGRFFKERY